VRAANGCGFFLGVGASGAIGRVGDLHAADAGKRREFVKIGAGGSHDVIHDMAANGEGVRNERAMAAPGDSFGAHDGAEFGTGQLFEARESAGELGSLHVVGETAKTGVVPAGVHGIGARVAEATEFWEMRVGDAGGANGGSEGFAVELGIVARARNGADVDQALDVVSFEEREKFADGMIGVADGEDERLRSQARATGF
jgi:hypothetical protein